jgi:Zn-dependent protease with chaperone function
MTGVPALMGRKSGLLSVQGPNLIFVSDDIPDETTTCSLINISVLIGGENSVYYFIEDRSQPAVQISFQDPNTLIALANSGFVPSAVQALETSSHKTKLRWLKMSSPIIIVILLFFLVPLVASFIPIRWLNGVLSFEQERKLGKLILSAQEIHQKDAGEFTHQEKSLKKLAELLQKSNPKLAKIAFEIYISDSAEVNAFALPGAIIVFNQGLLESAKSIEEIIGVLAHEMAHIERRHILKSLAGGLGRIAGFGIVALFLGSDASAVFTQVTQLVTLKYSREDESEADKSGFEFLVNAKLSPYGMIEFFNRLHADSGKMEKMLSIISTHPASNERVQDLEQLLANKNYKFENQFPVSLQDFRK